MIPVISSILLSVSMGFVLRTAVVTTLVILGILFSIFAVFVLSLTLVTESRIVSILFSISVIFVLQLVFLTYLNWSSFYQHFQSFFKVLFS